MARILVVEDEPDIALGLQQDLVLEGYEVEVVGEGERALERADSSSFDLILLDVMLPGKDGFAVCRELRRSGTRTPIIVLTAKGHEAEKVRGLELGADDYVTKPFSPVELRARIRSILRHRKEWLDEGLGLDHELRMAAEVQRRLFPQSRPPATTLDYIGFCHPALLVGGDYYDYLVLPDDHLGLLVADASGKGASAALVMASLHGCLRAHAAQNGSHCDRVVRIANALLHEATDPGRYATVFYAAYGQRTRQLLYVNAGHPAPIITRGDVVMELPSDCAPVGLFDTLVPVTRCVQLQPGDRLLIFSDGLTEAMNRKDMEFGRARLVQVLLRSVALSASDMRDAILAELHAHIDGCPQSDDVTFIAGVVL